MIDLQQADQHVEKIYRFIKQQKNGIAVDDIANQYPPRDATVPYAVALLLADGKVNQEVRGDKLYCVAVD